MSATIQSNNRDLDSVVMVPFTHKEYAEWLQSMNKTVVEKNGTYWLKIKKGFYQAIHLLARNNFDQFKFPTLATWGVRAALSERDKEHANIQYHLHMLYGEDLENFSLETLSSNRRNQIRRSFKRCTFVELLDKQVLRDEGYSVYSSCAERIGRSNTQTEAEYLPKCHNYINTGNNSHIVLAGFVEGRLGGFLEISAVDGVAYLESANFHSFALSSYVSIGLHYHLIEICRKSSDIHTLVHGQVSGLNDSLRVYKKSLNFKEVTIPAFIKVSPVIKPALKVLTKKAFGAKL